MGNAQSANLVEGGVALVDEAVVESLRAIFGDATGALMSKTRAIITERLGQMDGVTASGEVETLGRLAHEVGGMSAQVGLSRLSATALSLEALCGRSPTGDAVRRAYAEVASVARASLERLPQA
ncbi:Hpt domain-containing protein [Rubrimonas cliftonensis]|uniref:Hpt domain-containing protein n=1 Tax=Rubrimonas cliftonensis TaxID=89524 RepID=A0A1H4E5L2_9RHOB|nr:Hpt domain-containing protein [Rubrimonas cliftonensis]SEA80344.1 Hpt domain-containing protein [Rubrimonas cliftonensis]